MKDFATEVLQAKNIEIEFLTDGIDHNRVLDPALKQNLYLIFKESINNIVKHAHASNVTVHLINSHAQFTMTIQDDGKGFHNNGVNKGNGLRNIERRAKAMNAEFSIYNYGGTTLNIKRPAL
jgi:signal transduction histidine kinase